MALRFDEKAFLYDALIIFKRTFYRGLAGWLNNLSNTGRHQMCDEQDSGPASAGVTSSYPKFDHLLRSMPTRGDQRSTVNMYASATVNVWPIRCCLPAS